MPRRSKGARLYLRTDRIDARTGKPVPDAWFIRDGARQLGTGCGPDDVVGAETKLAEYISGKWTAPAARPVSRSDPAEVLVSEVIALYVKEVGPKELDDASFEGFCNNILEWWTGKTVADVRRSNCKAYAAWRVTMPDKRYTKDPASAPRVSEQTAARELAVLSAAIGHWHGEDTLTSRPVVWLPEQPETDRSAITRAQAARLLKAAMGWRWVDAEERWVRHPKWIVKGRLHLRRFVLQAVYTGTRHGVILALQWPTPPAGAYVDLDASVIYRRGKAEREKKNKKRPIVKIPPRLLAHMKRWHRADQARAAEVRRRIDAGEDIAPFANTVLHYGGKAFAGRIRTGFEGIVADAGLPAEITPHWLRHTAATWLMEADVSPWDAAGYLGMTVQMLEDNYAHHRPDYQGKAAKGVSKGRRSA